MLIYPFFAISVADPFFALVCYWFSLWSVINLFSCLFSIFFMLLICFNFFFMLLICFLYFFQFAVVNFSCFQLVSYCCGICFSIWIVFVIVVVWSYMAPICSYPSYYQCVHLLCFSLCFSYFPSPIFVPSVMDLFLLFDLLMFIDFHPICYGFVSFNLLWLVNIVVQVSYHCCLSNLGSSVLVSAHQFAIRSVLFDQYDHAVVRFLLSLLINILSISWSVPLVALLFSISDHTISSYQYLIILDCPCYHFYELFMFAYCPKAWIHNQRRSRRGE